jgi:ABC-type Fe3+ transport system substrate-binding protein
VIALKFCVFAEGCDVHLVLAGLTFTVDSQMQRVANSAVGNNLLAYDQRHGYRGASGHFLGADRQGWLARLQLDHKIGPLAPAIVTQVGDEGVAVLMSSAYNGRIHAAKTSGANLQVVWDGNLYRFDDWAIPKGTPNRDAAYDFISFSMRPEQKKLYTEKMVYGPSNTVAATLLNKDLEADLPTNPANMKNALQMDVDFWTDHGEALEEW